MTVDEMLNTMGLLGVGQDMSSPADKAIFLTYLNLAHQELFAATASLNQDLITAELLENINGDNLVYPAQKPHLVQKVQIQGDYQPLRRITFDQYINKTIYANNSSGRPSYYVPHKEAIYLYPTDPARRYQVAVFYTAPYEDLTLNTLEEEIPYPVAYHHVLLNGGLTFLFMDEGGFRSTSKEQKIEEKWERGKQDLITFLSYQSLGPLSTYSNV